MKLKKVVAAATATAALCCSCLFPAAAVENNAAYSKTINVKEGQVVTARLYARVNNTAPENVFGNVVTGMGYSLVRDEETLSYTDEVLSALPSELSPNFPSTMFNLEPEGTEYESLFTFIDLSNTKDFTETQMLITLDFDVNKTGLTTLTSDVLEAYCFNMDPDDDSSVEQTPYSYTQLEIYIDGYALGDCNKDGRLTVSDAIEIQKAIAGISTMDSLTESLADTDGNARISVADAIAVQKSIAGLVDFL